MRQVISEAFFEKIQERIHQVAEQGLKVDLVILLGRKDAEGRFQEPRLIMTIRE